MTLEKIKHIILIKTGINVQEKSRKTSHSRARAIFKALCSKYTLFSNEDIGAFLGISEGALRYAEVSHLKEMRYNFEYRFNYNEINKIIQDIENN
ncbi:hypothetical protein [Ornithobacterium rhinotracheale]|uniref:hypothetical protein n=1 Tax=Ornithobacterium rhinotracheale TaxID=28251 RepID=UPI00403599A4